MIQAAPLVLSFARAVPMLNKLVGAVGITELGNRVNNYIEKNPEESAKIVSMIMPAQGIANALKNKSSEDVEEVQESEIFMNKEKISLESNVFDDLNFDSLDSVQIVLELENVFDIDVTDDEIDNIKTIKDIVELVENLS